MKRGRRDVFALQGTPQLVVSPANQDQLKLEVRPIKAIGYVEHRLGPVSSEKNECGGKIGTEADANAFGAAVFDRRIVKPRMQDHSRSAENPIVRMAHGLRLGYGAV